MRFTSISKHLFIIGISLSFLIPVRFFFLQKEKTENLSHSYKKVKIIATTNILADWIKQIVDEDIEVIALMRPSVDPHTYEPTIKEMELISEGNILFYHGLHLEGGMHRTLSHLCQQGRAINCSQSLSKSDLIWDPNIESGIDPHIWFDIQLVKKNIYFITDKLIGFQPEKKKLYEQRCAQFIQELDELDKRIRLAIATIPKRKRVLITSHDAFSYYERAYNIEVKSIQGISTAVEPSLRDRLQLQKFIITREIPSIFFESSVNQKHILAIIDGCYQEAHYQLHEGGILFADSLGAPGTSSGTFLGMMETNLVTICQGLMK